MSESEDVEYYKKYVDGPLAGKKIAWESVPITTRAVRDAVCKAVPDFPDRCDRLTRDEFVEGGWKGRDTENVIRKQFLALSDEEKVAILRAPLNAGLCQELAPRFAAYLRAKKEENEKFLTILDAYWPDSAHSTSIQESSRESCDELSGEHELARGFNTIYAQSATIHLSVSLSLAPFFRCDIEERFSEICDSTLWHELVGFDAQGRGVLDQKASDDAAVRRPGSALFSFDKEERELERIGAECEIFRGLAYNEYLIPNYVFDHTLKGDVDSDPWRNEIKAYNNSITSHFRENRNKPYSDYLASLLGAINKIVQEWDCKIGLTKDGLGVVSFTRRLTRQENISVSDRRCSKEIRRLTEAPRPPDGEFSTRQLFNTQFNAAAIWILHAFMKDRMVGETIAHILKVPVHREPAPSQELIKVPWEVTYSTGGDSTLPGLPPVRNYFIAYLLEDIRGSAWGKSSFSRLLDRSIPDPSSDPKGIPIPKFVEPHLISKKEFITSFGNNFLALATGAYTEVKGRENQENDRASRLIPFFSKDVLSDLPNKDLSILASSMCFLHEENAVIVNPGGQVAVRGTGISYEKYWSNLVKGFAFLSRCKTLSQVLSRTLLECSLHEPGNSDIDMATKIQAKLSRVAQLLSRCRTASTPGQLSGLSFARSKFQEFGRTI